MDGGTPRAGKAGNRTISAAECTIWLAAKPARFPHFEPERTFSLGKRTIQQSEPPTLRDSG